MRFFYLTLIAVLITFSGCTMHPPSASGFMEAMERTIDGPDKSGVISATAKKNNFSMSADERDSGYSPPRISSWGSATST